MNSRESRRASAIFDALSVRWPEAHCELEFENSFQLLLAVLLSAQTTDKAVNKALAPLRRNMPNFGAREICAMGVDGFREVIKSIGLANTKASNAVRMAAMILDKHEGEVPRSQDDLEALPGVGRKTANVVRNVLFGEPTMPVDTHVARVAVRLGLAKPTENRTRIEEEVLALVPERHAVVAHHLLIFLGRYICTARAPRCADCPVARWCESKGAVTKPSSGSVASEALQASRRSPARPRSSPTRASRSGSRG